MERSKFYTTVVTLAMAISASPVTLADVCPPGTPAGTVCNPLGGATTIGGVISKIIGGLYIIAVPVASIFILWGVFQILTSQGEMEKISKGKKAITYAVIGLLLMILANGVSFIITDILK